jgi:hypothetical protein
MPSKLPDIAKSLVIQQWLEGKQRDMIAVDNNLSAGAVTNIVNEWRVALGIATADQLRDLAVTLKRIGITPAQCALGFRVAMTMINLGVKEDSFESFISGIYKRCKDLGLSPENIADHLKDLLEFSKTSTIPLSQIPNYINQKADEKTKLEKEIEELNGQIRLIALEKSVSETRRDIELKNENMTVDELEWYSNVKAELGKYGIPVDDISQFAKSVNGIRQRDYDVGKVLSEFSDAETRRIDYKLFQDIVVELEKKYDFLKQQCSFLEEKVNSHSQAISVYNQLEEMGFGLKELKLLLHVVNEIAAANNIPLHEAPQRLCKDIEEQYDNKLGFESKVEKLRVEVNWLSQEQSRLRAGLLAQPLIGPVLTRLIQSGVKEQDIINMSYLFERNSSSTNGVIDVQLLIAELNKYGSIKSTIQKSIEEADKLKNEVASLQTQKQDLETHNQNMLSIFLYSKQIIDLYRGSVSSLKYEIVGQLSIVAFITNYLLNPFFEQLHKLNVFGASSSSSSSFIPLIRAANGEAVPLFELKTAVIKAIEIIINKINTRDRKLSEILSEARIALMTNQH